MSKIFALVFVLTVLFAGVRTTSAASNDIDLVEMFRYQKDITISGVKLGTVMNVRFGRGTIADVYNDIYYKGVGPNQIVCKSDWIENEGRLEQKVTWSVWYRPGMMVSRDTECVDTLKKPWVTNSWWKQGYRSLGSGTEPHMSLLWLTQWTQIQKGYNPKSVPTYKWCKVSAFSFATRQDGDVAWGKVYQKAVFDFKSAYNALALVSRDIVCTNDVKTYSRWMKTPGWSFIFVESLY